MAGKGNPMTTIIDPASRPSRENVPAASRPRHAETPPPDHWQRWRMGDDVADVAAATSTPAADIPAAAAEAAAPPQAPAADDDAPYRILVIEDDRTQALFAQSILRGADMQARVLASAEGAIEAIEDYRPDLVLMDLHLPGTSGIELTERIRRHPQWQLLPIVFLTGDRDPERQYQVLEGGADDFLVKPIRPRHLVAAVANRIQRARQQGEPEADTGADPAAIPGNARVAPPPATAAAPGPAGAALDAETGLAPRPRLIAMLDQRLQARTPGSALFIEVTGAIGLRERYGYAAFEQLMHQAGQRLAALAGAGTMTRLGDNAFLVLAGTGEAPQALAARLCTHLSQAPFQARGEPLFLRGVAGYVPLPGTFAEAGQAIEAAERAMLQARLAPSGVAAYVPEQEQQNLAMLDGKLEPVYQPIVAVAGSAQAQYQLLLRLRKPDGTLLSAAQVVPAAEAAGRIADLDQQMIEHALGLLEHFRHAGPALRLFVSQSPRTLARDAFADWLIASLRQRQLPGNALVLEVPLDDALVHSATLQHFCSRLVPLGVQFCLGRFEPGDEANALIARLPWSFVRLSARFAGSHRDPALRDALRVAVDTAHQAGLQVIGQQIEDAQTAAAVWMGGVDYIQGNLVQSVGRDLDFDFSHAIL